MVHVRPGLPADASAIVQLLNRIIRDGGTTAITRELTRDDLLGWMLSGDGSLWFVATDDDGALVGFQWIGPWGDLPGEACDIASFVATGKTGLGIGSALFETTSRAARALGYQWINASIRADNAGGLAYYQSRGFRQWGRQKGVELEDGRRVDKVLMRYDLD